MISAFALFVHFALFAISKTSCLLLWTSISKCTPSDLDFYSCHRAGASGVYRQKSEWVPCAVRPTSHPACKSVLWVCWSSVSPLRPSQSRSVTEVKIKNPNFKVLVLPNQISMHGQIIFCFYKIDISLPNLQVSDKTKIKKFGRA